jgi:hypothetical protein
VAVLPITATVVAQGVQNEASISALASPTAALVDQISTAGRAIAIVTLTGEQSTSAVTTNSASDTLPDPDEISQAAENTAATTEPAVVALTGDTIVTPDKITILTDTLPSGQPGVSSVVATPPKPDTLPVTGRPPSAKTWFFLLAFVLFLLSSGIMAVGDERPRRH